jgi:hypothetical protein
MEIRDEESKFVKDHGRPSAMYKDAEYSPEDWSHNCEHYNPFEIFKASLDKDDDNNTTVKDITTNDIQPENPKPLENEEDVSQETTRKELPRCTTSLRTPPTDEELLLAIPTEAVQNRPGRSMLKSVASRRSESVPSRKQLGMISFLTPNTKRPANSPPAKEAKQMKIHVLDHTTETQNDQGENTTAINNENNLPQCDLEMNAQDKLPG